MSKQEKYLTLRTYLDSYKNLRKVKSSKGLNYSEMIDLHKSQIELFGEIGQKIQQIKKQLSVKDLNVVRNSTLRHVFDLESMLDNLSAKLKIMEEQLQVKKIPVSGNEGNKNISNKQHLNEKSTFESQMPIISQHRNIRQIVPYTLAKRNIRISTICTSSTTQDQTPKSYGNTFNKEENNRGSVELPQEKYFGKSNKLLSSFSQKNIQKKVFDRGDDSIIYKINKQKQ